jgi:hypothetical protein
MFGSGKHGTKSSNCPPVGLADLLITGKVVDESGMDDGLCGRCPAAQAIEVFQISAVNLYSPAKECLGGGFRTGKPDDLVAGCL